MNKKDIKTLKKIIKAIDSKYIEDVVAYPQLIQSFYTDVGAEPPSVDDIRLYLNKDINRRLKRIIVKEFFTNIIRRK